MFVTLVMEWDKQMSDWESVFMEYKELDRASQILFLESVKKDNEHLWDYSTMGEGLRKFFTPGDRNV